MFLLFSNLITFESAKSVSYTHLDVYKRQGLMKAVKEQPQFRLTSNFTFRTMQKVEEAILLREKKDVYKRQCLQFLCSVQSNKQKII